MMGVQNSVRFWSWLFIDAVSFSCEVWSIINWIHWEQWSLYLVFQFMSVVFLLIDIMLVLWAVGCRSGRSQSKHNVEDRGMLQSRNKAVVLVTCFQIWRTGGQSQVAWGCVRWITRAVRMCGVSGTQFVQLMSSYMGSVIDFVLD